VSNTSLDRTRSTTAINMRVYTTGRQKKAVQMIELSTAWQRIAYANGDVELGQSYQRVIDYWVMSSW